VAITDLSAQGIGGGDASIISDNLASKLQQSGKFRVMERSQMEQILKEQSFQHSGACDGNQCAVEMGKILGLDRIVVGSVGLVGSTYSFNLRLVDVASGEALRTSARTRKGNIDDVLTDLIPEAVADLSDLPQPASPTPAQERKRPLWPWIVSGTVVVAGGAFAAVLLAGDENKTTSNVSSDHFKIVW
jgi:curli biogenesis system outer membrane secretion channel CsgG